MVSDNKHCNPVLVPTCTLLLPKVVILSTGRSSVCVDNTISLVPCSLFTHLSTVIALLCFWLPREKGHRLSSCLLKLILSLEARKNIFATGTRIKSACALFSAAKAFTPSPSKLHARMIETTSGRTEFLSSLELSLGNSFSFCLLLKPVFFFRSMFRWQHAPLSVGLLAQSDCVPA